MRIQSPLLAIYLLVAAPSVAIPLGREGIWSRFFLGNVILARLISSSLPLLNRIPLPSLMKGSGLRLPLLFLGLIGIGMMFGAFTIYAAQKTRNCVYAIEPFPQNFADLQRNIGSNHLENIKTFQYTLSDHNSFEELCEFGNRQQHYMHKLSLQTDAAKHNVRCMTLKDFMTYNHLQQIHFLKLDC